MSQVAEEHRKVAEVFTARLLGVAPDAWDNPAPCEGWVARDVVRHLVEWLPGFLAAGSDVKLPASPPVDEDPVAAWTVQRDAVQALLDDPATADRTLANPHIGEIPLDRAIDQFYTADVFMHTWDLARATGQDESLDPEKCAQLLAGYGADGGRDARQRPVRPARRSPRRRRRPDPPARLHRPPPIAGGTADGPRPVAPGLRGSTSRP